MAETAVMEPTTRAVERRRFVQHNVLTTGSTLVGGFLGFVLQAFTSHALHPGQYGKTFAVVSLYTLLTRPAAAFGRLVAWETSRDLSSPSDSAPSQRVRRTRLHRRGGAAAAPGQASGIVLRQVVNRLLIIGGLVFAVSVVGGPVLGTFLHVPVHDIIVSAAAVPFLLATQPLLGRLQGEEKFLPWSGLSIFVMLSRLIFVGGFVLSYGAFGVLLGTTISSIVTFAVCLAVVWPGITSFRGRFSWGNAAPFIITAIASTLAIGVFLSADVIIVDHFFDKLRSGQYAAVAVVGNSVFFATGGVASVIFPIVAARHARDRSTFGVMGVSLGLCGAAALVGTAALQLFGHFILKTFAGIRYVPGDRYLGLYALGMGILGCVVVLNNTLQSLNRLSLLWVLIPATILRPTLLLLFHGTLVTVVVVSDLSIAAFAAVQAVIYVVTERARQRTGGGAIGGNAGDEGSAVLPAAAVPMS